jgi:hypothetical protein
MKAIPNARTTLRCDLSAVEERAGTTDPTTSMILMTTPEHSGEPGEAHRAARAHMCRYVRADL